MVYRKFSYSSIYQQVKVGVTAYIVLGSPKKNCQGIGICRIERASRTPLASTAIAKTSCCRAKALLTTENAKLILYFVKHTLPACSINKQFKNGRFPVDSEVFLPNEIAVGLGFQPCTFIKRGDYKVIDLGIHLAIAVGIGQLNSSQLNWR